MADNQDDQTCCICYEPIEEIETVISCKNNLHFICEDCIKETLEAQATPAKLRANAGKVLCPFPNCPSAPWTMQDAASWPSKDAREIFSELLDRFVTLLSQPNQSTSNQAENQQIVGDMAELRKYRAFIVENIINIKCPGCRMVFTDYEGCDALTCHNCGIGFCALCLAHCGTDAHQHVHSVHGQVYGGNENFNRTHSARRIQDIGKYLVETVPPAKVLKLFNLMERDLQDLRIDRTALCLAYHDVVRSSLAPSSTPSVAGERSRTRGRPGGQARVPLPDDPRPEIITLYVGVGQNSYSVPDPRTVWYHAGSTPMQQMFYYLIFKTQLPQFMATRVDDFKHEVKILALSPPAGHVAQYGVRLLNGFCRRFGYDSVYSCH